jgi:hypothetical protein
MISKHHRSGAFEGRTFIVGFPLSGIRGLGRKTLLNRRIAQWRQNK